MIMLIKLCVNVKNRGQIVHKKEHVFTGNLFKKTYGISVFIVFKFLIFLTSMPIVISN